jgi:hypothetical protein
MLTRLIYGLNDRPVTRGKTIIVIALQIILFLIFKLTIALFILLVFVVLLNTWIYYSESKTKNLNSFRTLSIVVIIIVLSVFTSPAVNIKFSGNIFSLADSIKNYSSILAGIHRSNAFEICLIVTGLLLVLNESNFVIRYLFNLFKLFPLMKEDASEELDQSEYNAGRIIGMLERILIFFFVLSNQFTAIGLVIAAKGFTRFKELDDRKFAEYVLVGTFLSAIFSVAIAVIIKSCL